MFLLVICKLSLQCPTSTKGIVHTGTCTLLWGLVPLYGVESKFEAAKINGRHEKFSIILHPIIAKATEQSGRRELFKHSFFYKTT